MRARARLLNTRPWMTISTAAAALSFLALPVPLMANADDAPNGCGHGRLSRGCRCHDKGVGNKCTGMISTDGDTICSVGKDARGKPCSWYRGVRGGKNCGRFDTADFIAADLCCGCGGGLAHRKPQPSVTPSFTSAVTTADPVAPFRLPLFAVTTMSPTSAVTTADPVAPFRLPLFAVTTMSTTSAVDPRAADDIPMQHDSQSTVSVGGPGARPATTEDPLDQFKSNSLFVGDTMTTSHAVTGDASATSTTLAIQQMNAPLPTEGPLPSIDPAMMRHPTTPTMRSAETAIDASEPQASHQDSPGDQSIWICGGIALVVLFVVGIASAINAKLSARGQPATLSHRIAQPLMAYESAEMGMMRRPGRYSDDDDDDDETAGGERKKARTSWSPATEQTQPEVSRSLVETAATQRSIPVTSGVTSVPNRTFFKSEPVPASPPQSRSTAVSASTGRPPRKPNGQAMPAMGVQMPMDTSPESMLNEGAHPDTSMAMTAAAFPGMQMAPNYFYAPQMMRPGLLQLGGQLPVHLGGMYYPGPVAPGQIGMQPQMAMHHLHLLQAQQQHHHQHQQHLHHTAMMQQQMARQQPKDASDGSGTPSPWMYHHQHQMQKLDPMKPGPNEKQAPIRRSPQHQHYQSSDSGTTSDEGTPQPASSAHTAPTTGIESRKGPVNSSLGEVSNGGGSTSKKMQHAPKLKRFLAVSDTEWRKSVRNACKTTFARLELRSDPAARDAILTRIDAGASADKEVSPCFVVKRDNVSSKSPFQIQVVGARILAQKAIFVAYQDIKTSDMGTWQVRQNCTHNDGSWWCFEPSHLEKCDRDHVAPHVLKHGITKPPDAVYIARNRRNKNVKLEASSSSESAEAETAGSASPASSEGVADTADTAVPATAACAATKVPQTSG